MTDLSLADRQPLASTARRIVLDTSALVADPETALRAYPGDDVVIPLVALEELDGLKKRLDTVGRAARETLRSLERLRTGAGGNLADPVAVVGGGTLRIALNGVEVGLLREHGLDPDKPDNRIIGTALGLLGRDGREVVLVSADASLRVKAAMFGIVALEPEMPAAVDHRPAGWRDLEVPPGVIDSLHAGEDPTVDGDSAAGALTALTVNEFGVLRSGSQSALVKRTADGVALLRGDEQAWGMRPRNKEQRFAVSLLTDPSVPVVALDGPAGTGKTLCAVAAGLEQVVEEGRYARLCVYRPVVPVGKADLGYLPGSLDEKLDPWMAAIADAVYALTERRSRDDAQQVIEAIKDRGQLVMESVTHLRGRTLHNSFVLVDEAQNLPADVVKTILTRLGDDSKVVFTGDTSQIDAAFLSEATNGLSVLIATFAGQSCFGHVRLTRGERSAVAELAARLL